MEGNVECYNNEAKVQLTISNTSLSSGNRKFTSLWCIFFKCTIDLIIDSNTSLRERSNSFFFIESQNKN